MCKGKCPPETCYWCDMSFTEQQEYRNNCLTEDWNKLEDMKIKSSQLSNEQIEINAAIKIKEYYNKYLSEGYKHSEAKRMAEYDLIMD